PSASGSQSPSIGPRGRRESSAPAPRGSLFFLRFGRCSSVVEHTTHNRVVGGSNPPTATTLAAVLAGSPLVDRRGTLVALSGGPDSTALLLGLLEAGVPIVAAPFDHRLRPESAAEAPRV